MLTRGRIGGRAGGSSPGPEAIYTLETNLRRERQLEGIAKEAAGVYKGRPASIDADKVRQLIGVTDDDDLDRSPAGRSALPGCKVAAVQ